MVTNISTVTIPQSENLKLHILLERSNQESVIASVLELPSLKVEGESEEQALEELKKIISTRLENIKVIPIEIELPQNKARNHWKKFAGIFRDDPDFAEIAESLRAERNIDD